MPALEMKSSPGIQGALETVTWNFNAASTVESLSLGGIASASVSACSFSTACRLWTGASEILSGSPTVSGSNISHVITGLAAGSRYKLHVSFADTSGTPMAIGYITCPEES